MSVASFQRTIAAPGGRGLRKAAEMVAMDSSNQHSSLCSNDCGLRIPAAMNKDTLKQTAKDFCSSTKQRDCLASTAASSSDYDDDSNLSRGINNSKAVASSAPNMCGGAKDSSSARGEARVAATQTLESADSGHGVPAGINMLDEFSTSNNKLHLNSQTPRMSPEALSTDEEL